MVAVLFQITDPYPRDLRRVNNSRPSSTMIVPIHVPASQAQNPYPPLARLGNTLFLIEMQGRLEVEGEREGGFVGTLIVGDKVRLGFAHEVSYQLLLLLRFRDLIGQSYATNRRTPPGRENSIPA